MADITHSCCQLPPIVSENYEPKGEYVTLAGLKTYVTGSSNTTEGILVVYDVFGYWPQTIQGADILAFSDKEHPRKLFMPDFFYGKPAEVDWYPPDTHEKEVRLGAFLNGPAEFSKTAALIPPVLNAAEEKYGIKTWGGLGYCWGSKVIQLSSFGKTKFKSIAGAHPLAVDPEDAKKINIPAALLPSISEDPEAIEGFQANHNGKTLVKWFPDQVHGWMAARGDFKNAKPKAEYERGYKVLVSWFHETL